MALHDLTDEQVVRNVPMSGQLQFQTPYLLEMQRRLIVAIRAASDSADTQAGEVINLTRALRLYTIVLAVIGAIQIAMMWWKG